MHVARRSTQAAGSSTRSPERGAGCRVKQALQSDQCSGNLRCEQFESCRRDADIIFDANPEFVGKEDAVFDGDDRVPWELGSATGLTHAGILKDLQTKAVSEGMTKFFAEALRCQIVAGNAV